MNKKALAWEYAALLLLAILLMLAAIAYYSGLGSQIGSLLGNFFKSLIK